MANPNHRRVIKDITEGTLNLKTEMGIHIHPENDDIYTIHFIIPGPEDTPFFGGLYHGVIRLSDNHPINPPRMYMITPTGRFIAETYPINFRTQGGICATFTAFHPESWSPVNNIETVLKGFMTFMCDLNDSGVGAFVQPVEKIKQMAIESHQHLINDPIAVELFPDIHTALVSKTYKPSVLGSLGLRTENLPKSQIKSETGKSKASKKTESSDSESESGTDDVKPKKISKKSIDNSEITKSKKTSRKSAKDAFSDSESEPEPEVKKSKKKSSRKSVEKVSESESEVEVKKPKKKTSLKPTKDVFDSESEPEVKKSKKKASRKPIKDISDSESEPEVKKPKKRSSRKPARDLSDSESEPEVKKPKKKASRKSTKKVSDSESELRKSKKSSRKNR